MHNLCTFSQNEADRTLIYITLYISECLKKLQKVLEVHSRQHFITIPVAHFGA